MVALIISAAASLVAGVLLGGCTSGADDISKTLIHRNSALETQLTAGQHALTALAISAVLLAGGLGVSLYQNKKGTPRGKTKGGIKAGQ